MSKSKRAKSGSAHDITKWETGLTQAILNEDGWKTCVFFLVSNRLEDNTLIDISCEVISTGLRKLFSVITKEGLFKEVKEYVKAGGGGGGKGKTTVKLPEFVEVCEQVKPFIDQDEDIPPSLLAKLLKFKLLHLKTKDFERREDEKKEKLKDSANKKPDKRAPSPGKAAKSPKKKGKKGEPEPPPSPKRDTKLKKRGDIEDTFKTIDDEPDDEGSPQHYILINGFTVASVLQHLANIGVHVNAIVKVKQSEYITINTRPIIEEKTSGNLEVEENGEENGVSQPDDTDEIVDRLKEEGKLESFWKESDELVINAPTGHKLKDIAKYEVVVPNTLDEENLSNVDVDKKTELGTEIFGKIANVCYDMLDDNKNYQRYLDSMKLLHVPLHSLSKGIPESHQSTAPVLATDTPKDGPIPVNTDTRYYNHLVSTIPDECISIPLILHCVLEQVVASVDETNPMEDNQPYREDDDLDNELAAHINSRTAGLALSAEEKQAFLEPDDAKKRHDYKKIPQILDHNDKLSQRLHYLVDPTVIDGLWAEQTMLDITPPTALGNFPRRTPAESMETNSRFQQFIQHCSSFGSPDNVSWLLKKYAFEGMPLKSVDDCGNILEPCELDARFSSYENPWDDPYSDLSKYFSSLNKGKRIEELDIDDVSAAVDLVSFRNIDDWCYVEQFDKNTLTQVLHEARLTHPYVDTYYHKHDDTLLVVFHNPVGKQLHSRSTWNVRLHSNVGFRNYLDHVSNMIWDWSTQKILLEVESDWTLAPVPVLPQPPVVQIKAGSRYGLKTREEVAILKAEEEDSKGKKGKNKRSAKSRTPAVGGKKSAGSEKKGSAKKNRPGSSPRSGSRGKSSKTKVVPDVELQPEVNTEGGEPEEEAYDFLGYDVGDNLMHVTGVQSSMFPCDGGQIQVEKTRFVHRASTVSASVFKHGDILKLHFLEPLEERVEEKESLVTKEVTKESLVTKEASSKSLELDVSSGSSHEEDGLEKSEFEENEKESSIQADVSAFEPPPPVFCKHASFVALLKDGMVISSSGFGPQGIPTPLEGHRGKQEAGATDQQALNASPQPKAASPKSRKKNDEEARRLEELKQAEERKRAEEEARRLEEQRRAIKKPFHEIFVSSPDGLHVSYQNDENYSSVGDAGGVVVRQRYLVKSRGLHECEAVRGKAAAEEISRCVRTDGTVIKLMMNNSVEVLYPDGMTCRCPVFPSKLETSSDRQASDAANQASGRKMPTTTISSSRHEDEEADQSESISMLHAEWTTVLPDGERFVQNLDGSKTNLEPVKLSVATCPVTQQIYKTREDNIITVIRPDRTQIVEHSDGTRITTFYQEVQTEIVAADHETGEEPKYESHLSRHIKVEYEGFATVVMDTERGSVETLFGNGNKIKSQPNGDCILEKCDGAELHFDIKGNVVYIPYDISYNDGHATSFPHLKNDSSHDQCAGVYFLRTTSQHCCEMRDQKGNTFSVFANGETEVTNASPTSLDSTTMDGELEKHSTSRKGPVEKSKCDETFPSLPSTPHVPRFFVMRRDGTGSEILRHQDIRDYLEAADSDASTAVLRTPVEGYPGVTGITVLKPFSGGIGKTWLREKDEKILIPEGLRERDFKVFPAAETKKIGPKFGTTAGTGLNIGNMRKPVDIKPQLTCPKVLVLRHLVEYEPSDITHRHVMSAAFKNYGYYVTKRQMQADNVLPREPRGDDEVEKAKELAKKYEAVKSMKYPVIANNNVRGTHRTTLTDDYLKSVTPAENPPLPAPVWKRPAEEWERDRIELAKLEYGKHALRYQEVPPYFETSQGQAFLNGVRNVPDMKKLAADLDKRACPDRAPSDLSGSSSPVESGDSESLGNSDPNFPKSLNRHSSVALENLENENDQPVQSSTPFASRPVNPTPAQAAGGPTPTSVRPTNPTPRQASNVTSYGNSSESSDSPRNNNVHSVSDYTPLEALLETGNELSYEELEERRVDNDTAFDLISSANSQFIDDAHVKSFFVDVTGSPRREPVKLPSAILGGKPGALPNTQFSTIEEPVRRKLQTVSVTGGNNVSTMRGFELLPSEVDFGVLKEGCTYIHTVMVKNIGIDSCRFKIRQPPPSTGMKVLFTPGAVAAGMSTKIDIEIFAVAVGVSGECGIGSIGHHIEIIGETDIIYLPVTAVILTAYEYDNRSPAAPQGGLSRGTQMISNRPPSREAIRPRREHVFSNVSKQF